MQEQENGNLYQKKSWRCFWISFDRIDSEKKGLSLYWSKDTLIAMPFFNHCMPRDPFQLITAFLHFNNNEAIPDDNPDNLYKIRLVLDFFVSKWQTFYSLEHINLDEDVLKRRVRLSFLMYSKDKPIQYGINACILADYSAAYCWNIDIFYHEKKTIKQTVQGLLTMTCTGLLHSVYMDNGTTQWNWVKHS